MTAEEMMDKSGIPLPQEPDSITVNVLQIKHALIEFAKYHVKLAKEECNDRAKDLYVDSILDDELLRCYPLTNIK